MKKKMLNKYKMATKQNDQNDLLREIFGNDDDQQLSVAVVQSQTRPKRVGFDFLQGTIVKQRQGKFKQPVTVSYNTQLHRMVQKNRQHIDTFSTIHLNMIYSTTRDLFYLTPARLELDISNLPSHFEYIVSDDGHEFLQETIRDKRVLYRISQKRQLQRYTKQEGVSSLIVFFKEGEHKLFTNENYSTWIEKSQVQNDFTIISRKGMFFLWDEHCDLSYHVSQYHPPESRRKKRGKQGDVKPPDLFQDPSLQRMIKAGGGGLSF